jgi:predicted Zn-dependent protease
MGGTKGAKKRVAKPGTKARGKASVKSPSTSKVSSIERTIEDAYAAIEDHRVDEGLDALRREAKKFPNDAIIAETYALACAEYGSQEEAISALKRAAMLSPSEGYEKFMYLGQLLDDGEAATTCTRQGLALLEMQASPGDEEAPGQHASACCALAEQILGTSDECDEEMSAQVEELINRARASDPSSAEPLQLLASLRNEQGKADDALVILKESIAMWRKGGSMHRRDVDDENVAEEFQHEFDVTFEFRFETAKLLLELDTTTDLAIQILDELLVERDTVVDVWYMLAYAHHGALDFDTALEHLDQGEELIRAQGGDQSALENFAELRQAVNECKATVGSEAAPMED